MVDWKNIDTSEKVSLTKPIFEGVMFVLCFVGIVIGICFLSEIKTYFG